MKGSTHMHTKADGTSYAHTHPVVRFVGGVDLGFTPHHHEPAEQYPTEAELPTLTGAGVVKNHDEGVVGDREIQLEGEL